MTDIDDQEREALEEIERIYGEGRKPPTLTERHIHEIARAALAAREEPQACTCRHPPEGVIGWDRGMVDRECSVHGHEALPERRDPQIEKVIEAMRATGEQEAWNDWYPKSPPSKRNAHRHGFNAGQAAGLIEGEAAAREDTERPDGYWNLCCECGYITIADSWLALNYNEAHEDETMPYEPRLIPAESDPSVYRCPACGHDHQDNDSGGGVFDGTRESVIAERARLIADGWEFDPDSRDTEQEHE